MALLPPSATISPFHLRKGEGGTGTFFYTREKKKKKSCLFFSGGGLIGFFLSLEAVGLKFSSSQIHTCTHTHTNTNTTHLGSLAVLGPTTWSPEIPLLPAGLTGIWLHGPSL